MRLGWVGLGWAKQDLPSTSYTGFVKVSEMRLQPILKISVTGHYEYRVERYIEISC